jgi:hypothetical protein
MERLYFSWLNWIWNHKIWDVNAHIQITINLGYVMGSPMFLVDDYNYNV